MNIATGEEAPIRFGRSIFGLNVSDVRHAIESLQHDKLFLQRQLMQVQDQLRLADAELTSRRERDNEMRESLIQAQAALEEQKANVERDKAIVLAAAHQHAEEIQQRAQRRVNDEEWELHRVKVERQRFIDNFKTLLNRHLEEVDRMAQPGVVVQSNPSHIATQISEVARYRLASTLLPFLTRRGLVSCLSKG